MANIVRCEMPDGVHRFKPFTVADYRDFILIRNDMNNKSPEEQKQILDELLEEYFGEYPVSWRPYMFIELYTSSLGKTKIPIRYTCSKCEKDRQVLFNLKQTGLVNPTIEVAGLKLTFKFPEIEYHDKSELILNTLQSVEDENGVYNWTDLSEEDQLAVIDAIDLSTLEDIVKQTSPIHFELKYGCCNRRTITYTDILEVFKLIVNPDEIFLFYQINHLLVKNNYSLESIMQMIPIERGIALSLVEKDLKK
ncbi:baseplate [Phage NC-G]|nr:baseplate [Phage NC-G]